MELLFGLGVNVHNNPVEEFNNWRIYSNTTTGQTKQWDVLKQYMIGSIHEILDDIESVVEFIKARKYKYKYILDV